MVFQSMFRFSQFLLCYPPQPTETSQDGENKWEKRFRIANEIFTWLDLLNLVLDFVFAFRLLLQGFQHEGTTLLIGMAIAMLASHLGNTLVNSSMGLEWKPFCQTKFPPERAE